MLSYRPPSVLISLSQWEPETWAYLRTVRCSQSDFSGLWWVLLIFPLRIWDTGTLPACRHYGKETQNWELGLLLLYWLPCIPFAGPEIPRGCNPLGKVKLARNSKSQHSSGCWAHPQSKLSVLFVQSTAHSQPPQMPSDPAGLWPNMRLFPLLMASSLPTQAVREQ